MQELPEYMEYERRGSVPFKQQPLFMEQCEAALDLLAELLKFNPLHRISAAKVEGEGRREERREEGGGRREEGGGRREEGGRRKEGGKKERRKANKEEILTSIRPWNTISSRQAPR
jgi:hypothetical protein